MRVRRVGLLAVLCAALVACSGGGGKAVVLPKISASSPASASPDPVPTAAKAPTPEGAAAFARFFYARVTEAFAAKDPSLLAVLSEPGCKTCQRYLASLTRLRDRNERVTPVVFQILFAEAPSNNGMTARVDVQYNAPATTRYDSSGRVIYQEKAAARVNETVELVRRAGAWKIAEIA